MNNPKIKKFAPIIMGLGISGLLLVVGFNIIQGGFARANDIAPTGGVVQISEITADSARISWTTSVATQCVIQYNSSLTAVDSGSYYPEIDKATTHNITLTLLAESTDYYFNLKCEDKVFDNSGAPYTFKTLSKNADKANPSPSVSIVPATTVTLTPPAPSITLAPTAAATSCTQTDCNAILNNIGKGCTYGDYLRRCGNKSPTPTLIAAPTITPTPTPTP